MTATKTVNYTPEMEQILLDAAPFDKEGAKALAVQLGKVPGSIIAKIKRLEADVLKADPTAEKLYIAQPAYVTKAGGDVEKKADIVAQIATMLEVSADSLVKAGKADLVRVRDALVAMAPEAEAETAEPETVEAEA